MTLIAAIILLACSAALVWAVASRRRQYRYAMDRDYRYDLENSASEIQTIRLEQGQCAIDGREDQSLILRCRVKAGWLSFLFEPYIETVCHGKVRKHYFEHRASGVRFIDLSEGVQQSACEVSFRAHWCRLDESLTLYRYEPPADDAATVLVLSPHADDAEIAAFGLYSRHNAHVVTITAGEDGKCDYCDLFTDRAAGRREKGLLRVHDALHIPDMGGVGVERCAVLGYFGMTLKQMNETKEASVRSKTSGLEDIGLFRRTSHCSFILNDTPEATWSSLVQDLKSALEQIRPDIVVTPHPQIDSNSDHVYTTIALAEAAALCGFAGKILTYTNHHAAGESYPNGPMFSSATLPPWFDTPFRFDAVYSNPLSKEEQIRKFFALEAMHDLRDATAVLSLPKSWKQVRRLLRRNLAGRDKSYFRRAVRESELFYVFNDVASLEKVIN